MDFVSIRDFCCAKVSKTDTYSKARCLEYVLARHKMIYEAFDWKAAQIIVDKTLTILSPLTSVSMPEVHHVLSVKIGNSLLDPVSASFVFDNLNSTHDDYSTAGKPRYYEEFFDVSSGTRSIRFFPPLAIGSDNSLSVLGKAPYSDSWTAPAIPQTENALIAFVLGDMWEYLHQLGKADLKQKEASALLQAAQQADTPSAQRPRMTKRITPTGNSLVELTDAVCDIIGDWTPATRTSVKDRIRRNYQSVWDYMLWPESTILVTLTANDDTAILPYLIDKVIGVRANWTDSAGTTTPVKLDFTEGQYFLGVNPAIFDQTGQPVGYSLLLPSAMPVPTNGTGLLLVMEASETASVFIKGELDGVEMFETVTATHSGAFTVNGYDDVLILSKPITTGRLLVEDFTHTTLMALGANEESRLHQRIKIYPSFTNTADQSLAVLGKRRFPQLMDDGDTCQLTGIENIVINGAAADMMLKMGKADIATALKSKADANMQLLVDRETKQATYEPRVIPYTEPSPLSCYADWLG